MNYVSVAVASPRGSLQISIKLALAIALVSLSFTPVQAQPSKSEIFTSPIFNAPPPPGDIKAPGNRVGGGKRGCGNTNNQLTTSKEKQLTALVPVYQFPNEELVLGLTTSSHPTFWFYVPDVTTVSADFVLQNEDGETIYQTPVSLSGTPGIVSLSLPSTASSLKISKRYHWYFNIYCNQEQSPIFVNGWIKRIELSPVLKSQLEKATPKQRVALYATNGIWYESLTASAELRRIEPKHADWARMLQAVGLNNIALEPIVDCCR
ncbi:DUF928 domain-containing protein [Nostoc sp. UCD121]|uniref:DUF928 domain-containing protein n=1 Tax=unclassified Nostoc TaxID=2593658 RepID=UPI001623C121|nr:MULTISPECIES: DUF928 domain-containing protein [unclassified Nostoc]MBC1223186.1 DUF928 domain-containing protein [Nostoc sp. UCD120]MBC1278722.1 DUF928 domain-containing protein [Nostoc sp. UCD121]MBC1295117.1 DUF928 domain-containing protein [Nostoc sp. UCD122]